MQLYGFLVLLVTLSAVCGLRCYGCDGNSCTNTMTCPEDRCFSTNLNGIIMKGCISQGLCQDSPDCCDTDLCNSAVPTASSVLLMLVSSAIVTLFL